jgi:transcriptional regulator with XRE-family HTH domain
MILLECLKHSRREAGLTQVELAAKLETDQSYVSKYERGERRLDIVELRAVCIALDLNLSDFVNTFEKELKAKGLS